MVDNSLLNKLRQFVIFAVLIAVAAIAVAVLARKRLSAHRAQSSTYKTIIEIA